MKILFVAIVILSSLSAYSAEVKITFNQDRVSPPVCWFYKNVCTESNISVQADSMDKAEFKLTSSSKGELKYALVDELANTQLGILCEAGFSGRLDVKVEVQGRPIAMESLYNGTASRGYFSF